MRELTLIIPAKNESESLPLVLNELKKYKLKIIIILSGKDLATINSVKKFNCKVIKIFNDFALEALQKEEQLSNENLNQDSELPNEKPEPSSDELLEEELALDYMSDGLDQLN